MQVVALDPGVIVARSAKWQTTCTLLHHGEETFIVDSPIFPDELDALPGILGQAGWGLSGLLATHGDWDHLLARLAFPEVALGVAETTAARLRAEPGVAQRRLREVDEDDYVARVKPLSLGQVQALPVPGKLELGGDAELELIPADGHTADGMAVWAPFASVLVAGDYLSPVEIPMLSEGGSRNAYVATLLRLAPYVEQAEWVVPGHGAAIDGTRALAILREDIKYLESLGGDGEPALPLARRDRVQKKIHAENVARVGASS
ncbi:MBL fold metallo-hydrolase [Baekduia sp.]|uniref:MBL fold metallo-hydrolase n=1 Tax=Baekduia sp. TaxID=2600305 RepID=UPI002E0B0712|nr:MBL fold metallo-hydrolase [Baekduia sp.]